MTRLRSLIVAIRLRALLMAGSATTIALLLEAGRKWR